MKKIIFLLAISMLSAYCKKDFLEVYPETSLNEANFYQSEEQYILLVNGCYLPMQDYEKNLHWGISEVQSDNSTFQFNSYTEEVYRKFGVIDHFISSPDNIAYGTFWGLSYSGISRCNKVLSEIDRPGVTWSKESFKDRCAGEALFLRALYYFNLVRHFGGVPLVLKPLPSKEAVDVKRSTDEKVYISIINDLKEAENHFSNASDIEENGRANWGAATSLLGKVYLTLHKYSEAEVELKSVIDSKKYDLLPNYADIFNSQKKDYKETIFALQYSENSKALSQSLIFMFVPNNSRGDITKRPGITVTNLGGWNQPTADLINSFKTGDKRKDVSIKFYIGVDKDTIPYCAKYKPPISAPDDRCGDNIPIIRYSDVLLMYAEVLNELGRTAEAIPYVQQVRNRAGLTNPLTGYNTATLSILIVQERRVELCFENQRWYDLLRTGKALEVMAAHGIQEKALRWYFPQNAFQMVQWKLLAPIPITQIAITKMEQNPGY